MSGKSHSPSPPRGRYGGVGGSSHDPNHSFSLLVRNIASSCRLEDFQKPFEQFGPLKCVYLPWSHYTEYDSCFNEDHPCFFGNPEGYGFIEYERLADAEEARNHMHGEILLGRTLTVLYADKRRERVCARSVSPAKKRRNARELDRSYSHIMSSQREHCRAGRNPEQSPSRKYEKSRARGAERGVSPSPRRKWLWKCQPEPNGGDKKGKP
ncbi:serine/arginine-rich SC35-like splicing factor SCL30A [Impatiens glandulifera]|uniref:serine/arginine-rich SC35-like splicing factor SCL30A n=1 Tax=Impatiens glandulifera TaxID=253017 RepID=UPI001FB0EB3D|nr:serine/arginine-rich SC35-like splicing factor SCL30A [Impatiens glandulifera]